MLCERVGEMRGIAWSRSGETAAADAEVAWADEAGVDRGAGRVHRREWWGEMGNASRPETWIEFTRSERISVGNCVPSVLTPSPW